MRKIYITLLLLTVALVLAPLAAVAQTVEPPSPEASASQAEAQKLAQVAAQLEDIENEVNRLTLLVTKITLERQAADLQRRLAAQMQPQRPIAAVPVAPQPIAKQDAPKPGPSGETPLSETAVNLPVVGQDGLVQDESKEERASGFAAALGSLGNLGTPEIAALLILAFLAVFVLVRRLSDRKPPQRRSADEAEKSPLPQASKVSQTPQSSPQSQPTLLAEGRQELSEKVAWK